MNSECLIITGLVFEILGVIGTILVIDPKPPSIQYDNKTLVTRNAEGSTTRESKSFDVKEIFFSYNKTLTDYNTKVRKKNRLRFFLLGAIAVGSVFQILALFL